MASKTTITTRSEDEIWLIGHPLKTIVTPRLPTQGEVLQNFAHHHQTCGFSVHESARKVYDEVVQYWHRGRLPIRDKHHVVQKVEKLHNAHRTLTKTRARNHPLDISKQQEFTDNLKKLFDIAHAKSDNLIKNEEDKEFLRLQRESMTGSLGPVDRKLHNKENRARKRVNESTMRIVNEAARKIKDQQIENVVDDDSETEETVEDASDSNYEPVVKSRKREQLLTPKITSVLDRTNSSVRKSTMIIASVLNEAGCSTSSAVLSKSTVHRYRQTRRKLISEEIKADFSINNCVVHWDGKLLPDMTGVSSKLVDRLPVLLSSLDDGTTKLLGVPKITSGTGKDAAAAVSKMLKSWMCDDQLIGMCFDTTASNTGRFNGACVLLESIFGRSLLWLACRHHMFEVLLSDIFTVCYGSSTGPEIMFFKRLRDNWDDLQHNVNPSPTPLIQAPDSVKNFIIEQLQIHHPRDDYRELLELSALLTGINVDARIRKPGAIHRARWMAKAIYSLKIELLHFDDHTQTVLKLRARELIGMQRFNRFVVLVYLQSWYTSRSAVNAPIHDINLINRLENYDDDKIRKTGMNMMIRHSWYLSPELATLSLFSPLIASDVKQHLVDNMTTERGNHLLTELPKDTKDLTVSRSFFDTTGLDTSFMDQPASEWDNCETYIDIRNQCNNIMCVNDVAERGVALIQQFNSSTKDEIQMQYLLQVVEKHRHDFKKCNRDQLVNM